MEKYKIVCVTPAGRRRYMQYLVPQILSSKIVDRYDIWVNTKDPKDLSFLKKLKKINEKVRLIEQPDGKVVGNRSINAFFKQAMDEDTIYIRLDDDIIWIEPEFFDKIVKFRIDNPQYFLISPLVINNALCTFILQTEKKFRYPEYIKATCFDQIGWKDGEFAHQLHLWFISKVKNGSYTELYCGPKQIGLNRFSINSICWYGKTFKEFDGIVLDDEEEYVSVVKPTELGKVSCFYCDAIIAHFAFYTQRDHLDRTNVLEDYSRIVKLIYGTNDEYKKLSSDIQKILIEVENENHISKNNRKRINSRINAFKILIPIVRLKSVDEIKKRIFNNKEKKRII